MVDGHPKLMDEEIDLSSIVAVEKVAAGDSRSFGYPSPIPVDGPNCRLRF